MSKILFLPQPTAQQICAKESMTVQSNVPLEEFNEMAVYAEGLRSTINRPIEEIQGERNAVLFGTLPGVFSTNAVVGIITIGNRLKRTHDGQYVYEVAQAYVLDKALTMSKRTARKLAEADVFFELPRYSVIEMGIGASHGMLSIYVNREVFFSITEGSIITLELDSKVAKCVLDKHGHLRNFKSVMVHYGNMVRRFEWNDQCGIETQMDDEGNPVCYPSNENPEGDAPRHTLQIFCSYNK